MNIANSCLELILSDKQSGEEWECSYDAAYIENLTRKTGNFKRFEIFTTMLKSGLLKTTECITLDLLTYEDLESLRVRRMRNCSSTRLFNNNNNRRYLIVTYSVEFDRINYPLPLEYCGPPDPIILQATVRRLELELDKANEELKHRSSSHEKQLVKELQKRVDELTTENIHLSKEIRYLTRTVEAKPKSQVQILQKTIMQLEKDVKSERNSHHRLVEKLQSDKMQLVSQLEKVKASEKSLKIKLQQVLRQRSSKHDSTPKHSSKLRELPVQTIFDRKSSPTKNQRSRSASPRIICSESWQKTRRTGNKSKSKSRSSSIASTRQSEQRMSTQFALNTNLTTTDSTRTSRQSSSRSYSNSTTSFTNSEASRHKFKKSTTSSCNR